MEHRIIGSTNKCVVCLKPAVSHSGFVRKGNEEILAGHCEQHKDRDSSSLMNEADCYGGWHESYGFVKE